MVFYAQSTNVVISGRGGGRETNGQMDISVDRQSGIKDRDIDKQWSQFRGCVKVEVAVLGFPS